MNELRMQLPKPRGTVRVLLFGLGGLSLLNAILVNWVKDLHLMQWLVLDPSTLPWQVHRFVTSLVLTSPQQYAHALFALMLLYFFAPPVEARVGTRKMLALMLAGGVAGNALGLLGNATGVGLFQQPLFFGPSAAVEALVVAWSMQNADATVQMFFVLPLRGRWVKWISLAFCVLGLLYPNPPPEGVLAGFGGFAIGALFGGQPALWRTWFLRNKLGRLQAEKARAQGSKGPPLRVVYGGLADELDLGGKGKNKPPRDKRTLN